jgi:hypothetical protein
MYGHGRTATPVVVAHVPLPTPPIGALLSLTHASPPSGQSMADAVAPSPCHVPTHRLRPCCRCRLTQLQVQVAEQAGVLVKLAQEQESLRGQLRDTQQLLLAVQGLTAKQFQAGGGGGRSLACVGGTYLCMQCVEGASHMAHGAQHVRYCLPACFTGGRPRPRPGTHCAPARTCLRCLCVAALHPTPFCGTAHGAGDCCSADQAAKSTGAAAVAAAASPGLLRRGRRASPPGRYTLVHHAVSSSTCNGRAAPAWGQSCQSVGHASGL